MEFRPLVSVIIPAFNAGTFLAKTIESVINQSYKNIEIIIVDNGSNDNTLEVALCYKAPNVTIVQCLKKSASAARNTGISLAKGEFIQYLDADDLLSFDKLENQICLLQYKKEVLCFCNTNFFFNDYLDEMISGELNQYEIYLNSTPFDFWVRLLGGYGPASFIPLHSWLIPVDLCKIAGPWNENLNLNDDGEYMCRIVMASKKIVYDNRSISYYRRHSNQKSLSNQKSPEALRSLLSSAILIQQNLSKHTTKSEPLNKAMGRMFKEIAFYTYPKEKKISIEAYNLYKNLNVKIKDPVIGGRTIEIIKTLFGWKIAKQLSYLRRNYLFRSNKGLTL